MRNIPNPTFSKCILYTRLRYDVAAVFNLFNIFENITAIRVEERGVAVLCLVSTRNLMVDQLDHDQAIDP